MTQTKTKMKEFVPTKGEQLKNRILELIDDLLLTAGNNSEEEDDDYDTVQKEIEEGEALRDEFEKYTPQIYIMVEGGNIQGISGTEHIEVNIYDMDNLAASDQPQDYHETHGTPEEWDKMITDRTANHELRSIY